MISEYETETTKFVTLNQRGKPYGRELRERAMHALHPERPHDLQPPLTVKQLASNLNIEERTIYRWQRAVLLSQTSLQDHSQKDMDGNGDAELDADGNVVKLSLIHI